MTFSAFDTFALSDAAYDEVGRVVGNAAEESLRRVQAALETDAQRARFARILARHARPVEQHEVQHRIDYGLGDGFKAPAALLEQLDIPAQSALAQHEDVVRAALELSAYTSEIARDPRYASVALILLSEHLLQGGGGAEGHVAVMVLDGLRAELDIAIGRPLGTMAPVPPDKAAEAWLALAHVPGENIARAAARLWARWFGRELAPLTPATESP